MISITTAVAAYAVVITVLYLIVQARVDEYDAEARDRAARRAKQPPSRRNVKEQVSDRRFAGAT